MNYFLFASPILPHALCASEILMLPQIIMHFALCFCGENLEEYAHIWPSSVDINVLI